VRHLVSPMTRKPLDPMNDLRSLWSLYQILRREKFEIIHTHSPKGNLLGSIAGRLAKVPVVMNTVHGYHFHELMPRQQYRLYVLLERAFRRSRDLVLSETKEDVQTAIRERICLPRQIRHLGNGIDLEQFDPARVTPRDLSTARKSLGIEDSDYVVGFVGRLVEEKGVRDLLVASQIFRSRRKSIKVLIVGESDFQKPDVIRRDIVHEYEVEDICRFAGIRDDMPIMYALMDVLVLPSYREGMPRSVMEASAMGKPAVVTDVRGCREVVVPDQTGLLIPTANPLALGEAIMRLVEDRKLASRLGQQAREHALEHFDERDVFRTLLEEYERLLATSPSRQLHQTQ
jgi:glycosyltransferase involved in cell wall biosynthesis